jgi:hypothetical protein
MKTFTATLALLLVLGGIGSAADDFQPEEGFTSLFNGKDLSGWEYGPVPVTQKPPTEQLEGKTATRDKVFAAAEGVIAASGGRVAALYTVRQFPKDFHLKLEFRATGTDKKDNSGIYIRGPQLQLDAASLGGRTGVFKNLKNFKEGDWNQIDIVVQGTEAICRCNGELVGKPIRVPENGTLGLQSEYGRFEFRRLRFRELP